MIELVNPEYEKTQIWNFEIRFQVIFNPNCGQFHQKFLSAFAPKKVQTKNVSTKKLCAKLWYEKAARKMLVKLTPGICVFDHDGKENRGNLPP
jgi:hypothetical protein